MKQARRGADFEVPLLAHLLGQRLKRGLAAFDPAAGQMPAGHVAVAHEEDAAVGIETGRTHAHRHAARPREITVQHPCQEPRLKASRRKIGQRILFHSGTSQQARPQIKPA